jgi:hypothetical protein
VSSLYTLANDEPTANVLPLAAVSVPRVSMTRCGPCKSGRPDQPRAASDARGIAQLMRLGWFRPVHCKSMAAQEVRHGDARGYGRTLFGSDTPTVQA